MTESRWIPQGSRESATETGSGDQGNKGPPEGDAPAPPVTLEPAPPPSSPTNPADDEAVELLEDTTWFGTAMPSKLPLVVRWFLAPMFARIKFSDESEAQIRRAAEQGVPVYVMRTASLLTFLYFHFLCVVRGLPLVKFANGVLYAPWAPWPAFTAFLKARWKRRRSGAPPPDPISSGYLERLVAAGHPLLLFMRSRGSPRQTPTAAALLAALVRAQRKMNRPLILLPQVLVWSRRSEKSRRTLLDVLVGGPEDPGPIRHLGRFLAYHRRASLVVAEPLDLQAFLDRAGQDRTGRPRNDAQLGHMLRRLMFLRLARERRVVQGPSARPARVLIDHILLEPDVQRAIVAEARRRNLERRVLEKRVRRYLRRIAADVSVTLLDLTDFVLQRVWGRIFERVVVDPGDIERLRRLVRRGTVVLVPCHRSHVDYLLVSDILYARDMAVPLVAAGINLSFWPLGALFRRIGAFFVQRSFKDDRLSPVLTKRYVAALLREGHSLEFFIEGGRSRTGLLLPPKLGLLSMIADQVVTSRRIQETSIVPVAIGYDRVVETAHYAREAQGTSKTPESLSSLFRSFRVLKERFGSVTVRFLDPIPLRTALEHGPAPYREDAPWSDKKAVLQPLGERILSRIARATPVTATQLVAAALLGHERRGILEPVLMERVNTLVRVYQAAGLQTTLDDTEDNMAYHVEAAIDVFLGQGCLSEYRDSTRRIFAIVEARRFELDYYRNAALTPVAPGAILAAVVARHQPGPFTRSDVQNDFAFLTNLWLETFVFDPDDAPLDRGLRHLLDLGVLETHDSDVEQEGDTEPCYVCRPDRGAEHAALQGLIRSHLEVLEVSLRALGLLRHEQILEKAFIKKALELARAMYLTEEIRRVEATNLFLIRAALKRFERLGLFGREGLEEEPRLVLNRARWEALLENLQPYLAALE